jgi:hypothetical protein
MSNRFKGLFDDTAETLPTEAQKTETETKPSLVKSTTQEPSNLKGRRSSKDHRQLLTLVNKKVLRGVERQIFELEDHGVTINKSELVEELLDMWISASDSLTVGDFKARLVDKYTNA